MRDISSDTVKNRFSSALANEGCELRKLLSRTDVVKNTGEVQNILDGSCKRVESLCREYAAEAGTADLKIPEHELSIPSEVLLKDWPYPNGTLSEVVESTLLFALSDLAVSYTAIESASVSIVLSLALTGIGMFALSKVKKHFKRRMIEQYVPMKTKSLRSFSNGLMTKFALQTGKVRLAEKKNNENFVKIFGKTGEATL